MKKPKVKIDLTLTLCDSDIQLWHKQDKATTAAVRRLMREHGADSVILKDSRGEIIGGLSGHGRSK